MKITDIHLKDNNLERKLPVLSWAANLAIDQKVNVVFNAGDLTESDHFAGRNNTPGAMVKAYVEAFSDPLWRPASRSTMSGATTTRKAPAEAAHCTASPATTTGSTRTSDVKSFGPTRTNTTVWSSSPGCIPRKSWVATIPQVESAEDYRRRLSGHRVRKDQGPRHEIAGKAVRFIILAAHCQVTGASLSASQLCKGNEGLVLGPEVLELFNDLHLGDIHMRQEILDGRGGFTGASTQEGFDEEGNPSGVEIVTIDDNSQVEHQWHACPVAHRYCTTVIEEPGSCRPVFPSPEKAALT